MTNFDSFITDRRLYKKLCKDQRAEWKFSRSLKAVRTRLGLTPEKAAALCGCTESMWIAMERPEAGRMPGLHTIRSICKGLHVTSDELLGLL